MREYEITYLISDEVSESDVTKITGKIGGFIRDLGGKILKEETWGRRKLAYEISKQKFATYITINFELPAEGMTKFEHEVRTTPEIIRHLIIVKDFGKEEISLTADEIAETEDIEEVVGGEKSFEAVEGETEESRDLMAVRGENEEGAEEEITDKKKELSSAEATEKEVETDSKKSVESKEPKKTSKKIEDATEKQEEVIGSKESSKEEIDSKEEKVAEKAVKKTEKKDEAKEKKAKDDEDKIEREADRLAKLDEELDEILNKEI